MDIIDIIFNMSVSRDQNSHRWQITDYRLQITDYRLQITDYRLQITDYRWYAISTNQIFWFMLAWIKATSSWIKSRLVKD